MIACDCAVCRSTDPRDKRLRPSIYLDVPSYASILVDAGPDLRQQALTFGVQHLDAILLTHAHADHILGLDEVRRFNAITGASIPCYASPIDLGDGVADLPLHLRRRAQNWWRHPEARSARDSWTADRKGVRVIPVPVWHGQMPVLGFRFGDFAYLTDCNRIDDSSMALVAGVDTLVIDALRERPHVTHFSVSEALDVIARLKPRRAYMTHMTHDIGHAATSARLPAGVELAYDGLVLDVRVDVE